MQVVAPGKYRLYWDGIDQNSAKPKDTVWVGSGSYTFRLTTSKTSMHYCGEINNSAPKYTSISYMMVNATSLAMTPPGTTAPPLRHEKWTAQNNSRITERANACLCGL